MPGRLLVDNQRAIRNLLLEKTQLLGHDVELINNSDERLLVFNSEDVRLILEADRG